MSCKAIRQGDQMCCGRCGLQWDVGDEDRPQCLPDARPPTNEHDACRRRGLKEARQAIVRAHRDPDDTAK